MSDLAPSSRRTTFARYLVDIVILAAFIVLVPPLLESAMAAAGYATTGLARIAATGGIFLGIIVVVMLLLALRGETAGDIGLRSPRSPALAVATGVVLAALIFVALEELQRAGLMGETRLGDMASELKGDLPLTLARMALSILVVGFTEEFVFRGFILDRIAKAVGGGRLALAVAVPTQATLFGLSHAYQGAEGMIFTGVVGLVFGVVFLIGGRNLWPVIVAHGVFDAARAAYLYATLTGAN